MIRLVSPINHVIIPNRCNNKSRSYFVFPISCFNVQDKMGFFLVGTLKTFKAKIHYRDLIQRFVQAILYIFEWSVLSSLY